MPTTQVLLTPMVDVFTTTGFDDATGTVTVSSYNDGLPYVRVIASGEELRFSQELVVTFTGGVLSEDIYVHRLDGGAYWRFVFEVGGIVYTALVNLPEAYVDDPTIDFGLLETVNPSGA